MKEFLVNTALERKRSVLLIMFGVIVFGIVARISIPTESEPRVEVPYFVISVIHEGISPEDALRLLVKPMELELKTLEGVKEITGTGAENVGIIAVEFFASVDNDLALTEVREAVSRAKQELPSTAEEPIVTETASTDFPLLQINLVSEFAPERVVTSLARQLRDRLETIPNVRGAGLQGQRDEFLEVAFDPTQLSAKSVPVEQLILALTRNNQLIPAGALASGRGSVGVKIPSVVEDAQDLLDLPIQVDEETVLTLDDVALVRRTFKDRTSYSRANGKQAVSLFVYRRVGANSIETADSVRAAVDDFRALLPDNIDMFISRDTSSFDKQQITELEGNIVTALFLVLAVVLPTVGFRSGIIVTASIPVSFLFAITVLWLLGYSFNFMVMFGMLMSLGMLIDGAIIVTEDAERRIASGVSVENGYGTATKRMFTPVVASMATTFAAFLPLLFWPGVEGQYMGYLPITVLTVLGGSLLFTLIFIPSLGASLAKQSTGVQSVATEENPWRRSLEELKGFTRGYAKVVRTTTRYAGLTVLVVVAVVYGIFALHGSRDLGVILFNENDPFIIHVSVRASGNLDIDEANALVADVEELAIGTEGIRAVTSFITSGVEIGKGTLQQFKGGSSTDVIGTLVLETHDANDRTRTGQVMIDELREAVRDIAGITVEVRSFGGFLDAGKPIFVQFTSRNRERLAPVVSAVRDHMESVAGLSNIEDTLPVQGFEWQLDVDRERAAQFGVDVTTVGLMAQLVTDGAKLGEYRPNDIDEPLDIRLRFTEQHRSLDQLDELQVSTRRGPVPISNFVKRTPVVRQDAIQRRDQRDMHVIQADVLSGELADAKVREIEAWLATQNFDPGVEIRFRAATEEQAESIAFVSKAFSFALLLMFVLLVTQFNSLYQSFVTIFTVVLSTAGVFLGLVITNQPFSAILSGVGVIALAGIVVNNSIVLIDTYNIGRRENPDMDPIELITKTGLQRLRPVLLTTLTTVIGLLPLASHQSIDFINRTWETGSTLSNYWVPLAQAVVFGLTFATVLTLVVTPAMLMLPVKCRGLFAKIRGLLPARIRPLKSS